MLPFSVFMKVLKMEQALGVSSRGACFGVTDPSRLRPPFRSLQKPAEELKEIFAVDRNLNVTIARIPLPFWERLIRAKLPVEIICHKKTIYSCFETMKQAEDFRTARLAERARRKRKRK